MKLTPIAVLGMILLVGLSAPADARKKDQDKQLAASEETAQPTQTAQPDQAQSGGAVEAVKQEISNRTKTTGSLDIYDTKIDKVRTLSLMDIKEEGDKVVGHFRDTQSGDVVTLETKVTDGKVADFEITGAEAPQAAKPAKKDYSDQEVQDFIKEYIDTQAAGTGTFMLFDEKLKKMRNLEFVKLQEKVRRYGIIAISTAEFKDKDTNDTILADVNVENKEGLNVTAVRIKSVVKGSAPAATTDAAPSSGAGSVK